MARVIRRTVVEQDSPIGVNNFDTGADLVGKAIANAGETLRRAAFETDARKAQKAGEEAAMAVEASKFRAIGADGMPEAMSAPEGFGQIARDAYQRVAERRFTETIDSDIRLKAQELRVKFDRNPIGFDRAMDDYLKGLGKNADGRFREFITQSGSAVKQSNYFSLVQAERNRVRVQAAQHILKENANHQELASNLAYSGNTADAIAIAYERQSATREGEGAELKVGTSEAVFDNISGDIAAGHFIRQASGLTKVDRETLTYLISTRGNYDEAQLKPSKKVLDIYNQSVSVSMPDGTQSNVKVSSLINSSNVSPVLAALNGANQDLYAVEAARQAELDRQRTQANADNIESAILSKADYDRDLYRMERDAVNSAKDSFQNDTVGSDLAAVDRQLINLEQSVFATNQANPTKFTRETAEALVSQARKELLAPYITQAIAKGENSENLQAAILGGLSSEAYGLLGKNGQAIVQAISTSQMLFDDNDIQTLSPLFSMSSSDAVNKIKQSKARTDFVNNGLDLSVDVYNGAATQDQIDKFLAEGNAAVDNGTISSDDFVKLERGILVNQSRAQAKTLGVGYDSQSLKIIAHAVNTGEDISDEMASLTDAQKAQINNALDKMGENNFTDSERAAVAKEFNDLAQIKADDERRAKEAQEKIQYAKDFRAGNVDATSVKAGEYAQEMADAVGFDINNKETWTPKAMAIMAISVPSELRAQFTNLANGRVDNADNLMSLFGALSYAGGPVQGKNLLNGMIDRKDMGILLAIQSGLATGLYRDSAEAVRTVNEMRRDSPSAAKARRDAVFIDSEDQKGGTISPAKWVDGVLGKDADFVVNKELAVVAETMAGLGFEPSQIEKTVKDMFKMEYAESAYVYDPSRPYGSKGKSRHALGAIFKDERQRKHVINKINSTLRQHGYTLYNPIDGTSIDHTIDPVERARKKAEGFETGLFAQRAVLVPLFPYSAQSDTQIFTLMSPVALPDGTTELAQIIIDDFPAGFRIKDEAADWQNPDFAEAEGMSLEAITDRVELMKIVTESMVGK